jgi:hypothetical protein
MNERSSIARAWSGSVEDLEIRCGEAMALYIRRAAIASKYFALQSSFLPAYRSSEVHSGHRVAPTGIGMRQ